MDLGRHIAAKSFGKGITEYKEIASVLKEGVFLTRHSYLRFKNPRWLQEQDGPLLS